MKWEEMSSKQRDELIAEKIMGWIKINGMWYESLESGKRGPLVLPQFSSDPTFAFDILEQFNSYQITKMFPPKFRTIIDANKNCAYSDVLMESICKACLIARDASI